MKNLKHNIFFKKTLSITFGISFLYNLLPYLSNQLPFYLNLIFNCSLYIYSFFIILKINKHLAENYQVSLKKDDYKLSFINQNLEKIIFLIIPLLLFEQGLNVAFFDLNITSSLQPQGILVGFLIVFLIILYLFFILMKSLYKLIQTYVFKKVLCIVKRTKNIFLRFNLNESMLNKFLFFLNEWLLNLKVFLSFLERKRIFFEIKQTQKLIKQKKSLWWVNI